MANFMFAYYGGSRPSSKEAGMEHMNKWKSWIDGLGESVVNAGTPFKVTKIVTTAGVEDETDANSMNGFAIIKADNIESAIEIAKSDPFLDMKGTIRVSMMLEM